MNEGVWFAAGMACGVGLAALALIVKTAWNRRTARMQDRHMREVRKGWKWGG